MIHEISGQAVRDNNIVMTVQVHYIHIVRDKFKTNWDKMKFRDEGFDIYLIF